MLRTFTRKRIELLLDTPHVNLVVEAIAEAEIDGYTLVPVQSGAGRRGAWRDDRVTASQTKVILITIASEEKALRLAERLAPILDTHSMLLTMADVSVLRPERF
jgi:PII-like signaling protein